MRDDQVAAWRERRQIPGHDAGRVVGIHDVVQAPDEQQPGRPGEVEQFPGPGQDLVHVAQVGPGNGGRVVLCHQRLGVHGHHRVVVHVHHARAGAARLGDLMDVRAARQPAADVDELADPGIAQEADRAHQEPAVAAHGVQDLRHEPHHLLGGCPVRGEVVRAAKPVVVHPGGMREVRADILVGHASILPLPARDF